MTECMEPPFRRSFSVAGMPQAGLRDRIEATRPEREAIAELLNLEGLAELCFAFTAVRRGSGRVEVNGELRARLTQACVISLEPMEHEVAIPIHTRFWPPEELAAASGVGQVLDLDPQADAPEPIVDGHIDLGQLAYEYLAADLDPYPRKSGVTFDLREAAGSEDEEGGEGPFAALKTLKTP